MVISEAVQRSIRDMLEKDLVLRTVLPHHFNHMSVGQVRNNGGISDERYKDTRRRIVNVMINTRCGQIKMHQLSNSLEG